MSEPSRAIRPVASALGRLAVGARRGSRGWAPAGRGLVVLVVLGWLLPSLGVAQVADAAGDPPSAAAADAGSQAAEPAPSAAEANAGDSATSASAAARLGAFEAAVAAYRAGAFGVATDGFAALAEDEPDLGRRAVLHADAGTAAARAQRFGEAIWHLEAALRLAPRDDAARRNLDQVRVRLGQSTRAAASFAETVQRLPVQLNADEARHGMALLAALGLLLAALSRAGRAPTLSRRLALAALVLAGLWWLADGWARDLDRRRAVVLQAAVVRAEPAQGSQELFRLGPGVVVAAQERRGDWQLVETEAGGRGWTRVDAVRAAGGVADASPAGS